MDEHIDMAVLNSAIAQLTTIMDEVGYEITRVDDLKTRLGEVQSHLIALDKGVKLLHNKLRRERERVTQQNKKPLTQNSTYVIVTQQPRKVKEEDI